MLYIWYVRVRFLVFFSGVHGFRLLDRRRCNIYILAHMHVRCTGLLFDSHIALVPLVSLMMACVSQSQVTPLSFVFITDRWRSFRAAIGVHDRYRIVVALSRPQSDLAAKHFCGLLLLCRYPSWVLPPRSTMCPSSKLPR
jgi:hypothetical protein